MQTCIWYKHDTMVYVHVMRLELELGVTKSLLREVGHHFY